MNMTKVFHNYPAALLLSVCTLGSFYKMAHVCRAAFPFSGIETLSLHDDYMTIYIYIYPRRSTTNATHSRSISPYMSTNLSTAPTNASTWHSSCTMLNDTKPRWAIYTPSANM